MGTEDSVKTSQAATVALAKDAASSSGGGSAGLVAAAHSLVIDTPEALEASTMLLRDIKALAGEMVKARLSITRPMDEAKKEVMRLFAPAVEALTGAERAVKAGVLAYTNEQARLRDEAQAKADAAAEREREQLRQQADAHRETGREGRAETLDERAEVLQAPTVPAAPAPSGGVAVKVTWHAEVVDLKALARVCGSGHAPLDLLLPNMPKLNALARTENEKLSFPGVRAVSEQGIAARGPKAAN